jgi:hypothetical protein
MRIKRRCENKDNGGFCEDRRSGKDRRKKSEKNIF